jgi:hypothetical protein
MSENSPPDKDLIKVSWRDFSGSAEGRFTVSLVVVAALLLGLVAIGAFLVGKGGW